MLFTRAERYALRSAIHLAEKPSGSVVTLDELSEAQGVSKQFLANILIHLTAAGLLHSYRGLHGGYSLNRPPGRLTVANIWDAVRGEDAPINCVVDAVECPNQSFCPIRHLFEQGFAELHAYLEKCTVQRLVSQLNKLPGPTTCGSARRA